MGTGFLKRKKEAKALQAQMADMQAKMEQTEAEGSAGHGLVTLTLSGKYEIKSLKIKPECVDPEDVEGLQDLIKSAYKDACQKLEANPSMNLPAGFNFPA